MGLCGKKRNFMNELRDIICAIESLKPEPEVCNARCPPLGCPRGPCPGLCCYQGICDPCCTSKMPCCPPPPDPPYCCAPLSVAALKPRCPFSNAKPSCTSGKCVHPISHSSAKSGCSMTHRSS